MKCDRDIFFNRWIVAFLCSCFIYNSMASTFAASEVATDKKTTEGTVEGKRPQKVLFVAKKSTFITWDELQQKYGWSPGMQGVVILKPLGNEMTMEEYEGQACLLTFALFLFFTF